MTRCFISSTLSPRCRNAGKAADYSLAPWVDKSISNLTLSWPQPLACFGGKRIDLVFTHPSWGGDTSVLDYGNAVMLEIELLA